MGDGRSKPEDAHLKETSGKVLCSWSDLISTIILATQEIGDILKTNQDYFDKILSPKFC